MKNLSLLFSLLIFCSCSAQTPKPEAEEIISNWYAQHATGYEIEIAGKEVKAETSDFYLAENLAEHRLVRVFWKGMKIEMSYNQPLSAFKWTPESLKKQLSYLSISDIYTDIELDGWKVYPKTPISAIHDGEGITFKKVDGNKIQLEIDWEIYTVFGYAQNVFCEKQLQIADSSMPKECYAEVRKRLPLKILVDFEINKK